ncbi:MAG: hypothetical protein QM490_05250 [Candidatus Gracilibacteria bacterium]
MNKFETSFFEKYIPEGQKIVGTIHIHFIDIFSKLFLWLTMGALIPSFLYFYSERIKDLVPFYYLELLLIIIFIKIIYDIFDWYNDVWIITDEGVVALERALFKTGTISVDYEKIEGLEVDQVGISDKFLKKGDLKIHKFGDDTIVLRNAINPYRGVDLIEETSTIASEREDKEKDKFDIIMDALGGVVENYIGKKMKKDEKEEELYKVISKIEKNDGTIDLR